MPEDDSDGDRKEYYLGMIQDIVDEQKEFLGSDVALKQARRAPLEITPKGEVVNFYGSGDNALETLRDFTEHQEFYLKAIQRIIDGFSTLLGPEIAGKYARKAPLEIMPGGDVQAYYGKGKDALITLVEQYEKVWGEDVAHRKVRHALEDSIEEDNYDLLPDYLTPDKDQKGMIGQIISQLRS